MRRYINEEDQNVPLPVDWNKQIDPRSQAVHATDDIETLALGAGLVKSGLSAGLPKLGKLLGIADDVAMANPSLVASEVGAAGKNIAPLLEQEAAKKAADLTAKEAAAKALADKAAYGGANMNEIRKNMGRLNSQIHIAETNRLNRLKKLAEQK